MPPTIQELLDRSRKELLDLSTRNRLLSIPVNSKSARIIQVYDELSVEIFRLLVTDKKRLSFLPGKATKSAAVTSSPELFDDEELGLPQPEDDEVGVNGIASRHSDPRLQTSLTPEGLQRRLLDLYTNARTMIEEQGVNVLYLALGELKWFESGDSDTARYAPLILIPVELERKTASDRFRLRWREEDIESNLSLETRLKNDFAINLPAFTEQDDFNPEQYFDGVALAIDGAKNWEVLPNSITLGFFSFAKLLMYRDLDSKNWPNAQKLLSHSTISCLLADGFAKVDPVISEDARLDELIPAAKLDHVVDADSSQTVAIERVHAAKSLVIQGPPGTGKSQSISNMIASAVLDGKTVLFVAEKLAALEVVKHRLEKEGLGALCLELHSNKAKKRAVLDEIGRTWFLGRPKSLDLEDLVTKLDSKRAILNEHVAELHEPHQPSMLSYFVLMGRLTSLRERGREGADLTFPGAESWTPDDFKIRRDLLEDLAGCVEEIGIPARNNWRGVCREVVLNIDLEPLGRKIQSLRETLSTVTKASGRLSSLLNHAVPETLHDIDQQLVVVEYVAQAPTVNKEALCAGVWNAGLDGLSSLLAAGRKFSTAFTSAGSQVTEATWERDSSKIRSQL